MSICLFISGYLLDNVKSKYDTTSRHIQEVQCERLRHRVRRPGRQEAREGMQARTRRLHAGPGALRSGSGSTAGSGLFRGHQAPDGGDHGRTEVDGWAAYPNQSDRAFGSGLFRVRFSPVKLQRVQNRRGGLLQYSLLLPKRALNRSQSHSWPHLRLSARIARTLI